MIGHKKQAESNEGPDGQPVKPVELSDKTFYLKVYSAYETYYDDQASSISAENDTGPFDILPRHHSFMTLVNAGEVTIRLEGSEDKKLRIAHGVLHVRDNKVTLFLDV